MKTKTKIKMSVFNWIIFAVLLFYAISMIVLILWGVFTSLKTRDDFYINKLWLPSGMPSEWGWSNFVVIWQEFEVVAYNQQGQKLGINIIGQTYNTIVYAFGSAFVQTACCCLVAYLVANFDYTFSNILYTLVIALMVIPVIGNQPAMLRLVKELNIYDTFLGNFIMKFTFSGMHFLLFFASFKALSKSYAEAAMIDGAGEMRIMLTIIFPLVKTMFYTIFLIKFIDFWNDYQTPLLYMPTHPTLAYGVYDMSVSRKQGLSSEPMRLASCMFLAIPILVVFLLFRDKIMGNLTMGGVKE